MVLCRHVFHNLCLKLVIPTVDLFASRVPHQVVQYVPWKRNSYRIVTDAVPWTQGYCYKISSFSLIPHVLSKIQQDQVHTVKLITLCWQIDLLYPQVLGMLIRIPILLPTSITLLVDPIGNPHPSVLNKTFTLVTWQVSERYYHSREFPIKQPSLVSSQEGIVLWEITNRPGRNGLAGETYGKLFHFGAM